MPKVYKTMADSGTENSQPKPARKTRRGVLKPVNIDDAMPAAKIYTSRVYEFQKLNDKLKTCDFFKTLSEDNKIDEESVKTATGSKDTTVQQDQGTPVEEISIKEDVGKDASHAVRRVCPPSPTPAADYTRIPHKIPRKTTSVLNKLKAVEDAIRTSGVLGVQVDDLDDDVEVVSVEADREILLKICWRADILRVPIKMNQKLYFVYTELSRICGCSPSEIILSNRETTLHPEDTPASLKLSVADILDCYIRAPAEEGQSSEPLRKEQMLQLKIQSKDAKNRITIEVNKMDPMSVLMEKYSNMSKIPLNLLNFYFDGDLISPHDTPMDLDLEDGCCIDVTDKKCT